MAESDRSAARRFRLLGVIALVVGVVGALALWLLAGKRYDDAVSALAPAPVGCDTTLVFDRPGTYTFFVETTGSVGEIDGDCDNDDRTYDLGDDPNPRVELALVDEDGEEIDLDRADGPTYDRAGAVGAGFRTAEIEAEGSYVLSASAEDVEAMVRVGRDPANGVTAMRVGAVGVLLAGVVLGGLAFWRARSQWAIPGQPDRGPTSDTWPPRGPHAAPIAPPYANPPRPPPYGAPPGGGPWPPPQAPTRQG